MKAIANIPAPSPTNAPDGQSQKGTTSGDNSFASTLSAVTTQNKNFDGRFRNSSRKTISNQPGMQPRETVVQESGQAKKLIATQDQDIGLSSSGDAITNIKYPADKSSAVDTDSKTAMIDKAVDPTLLFTLGTSGYFFSPPQDLPVSNLLKTSPTNVSPSIPLQDTVSPATSIPAPGNLPSGKDGGPVILRNATPVGTDIVADSQLTNVSPSMPLQDTVSPPTGKPAPGSLPSGKDGGPNILQDQSTMPPTSGKNIMQTGATSDPSTLIAQQLQKILSINGPEAPIISRQPTSQNQVSGQDSLSRPLFAIADTSTEQTPPISDLAAGAVISSLAKESPQGGKNANRLSSEIKDNHPGIITKADEPEQKVSPTVQEKEALLQNTADHRQTTLATLTYSRDTMGIGQQTGQLSFGNIFIQNLQPGQHTTGTTGSNTLPLWTPSQENALVNQVMQNFQITPNSPSSRLVLKLYPEELGELKIDLQMKDGAIKANIFTHSEQVQQVLEKYIPKLRSLMEQQGLTVDDILVTNTSGNVDGHTLFQQDFADNHDFSQPGKSAKAATFTDLTFEKVFSQTTDTVSGVNVTI